MNNDIITTNIDRLGLLLAEIDRLTKDADKIKDNLKNIATLPNGEKEFVGNLYRALVVSQNRSKVNYEKLFEDLKISQETVKKYSKTIAVFSVKTTAR